MDDSLLLNVHIWRCYASVQSTLPETLLKPVMESNIQVVEK